MGQLEAVNPRGATKPSGDDAKVVTLPNGLRIALDPMPMLESTALGVWIQAGARDEAPEINGVAHLFEHMAFKGAGQRDARAFAEAIESVGGAANAATGFERTSYYARCLADHAGESLHLLCDMLLDPHWHAEDLEKEKGVVIQEIHEAFDSPEDRAFELHQRLLFPDQALGRPILGNAGTLAGISVGTLRAFRSAFMVPSAMVLSVCGRFDSQEILGIARQRFGALPGRQRPPSALARPSAGLLVEPRRAAQAHLVFSWPAPALGDSALMSARLLAEILGGGMASRLFQEVRENLGLAYSIDAFLDVYHDTGRLLVTAGCAAKDAGTVSDLCAAALLDLAENGPTDRELTRARTMVAAQVLMGAESAAARAEMRAGHVLTLGALLPFDVLKAQIRAVTGPMVQARAREAVRGKACAAALGPSQMLTRALRGFCPRFG